MSSSKQSIPGGLKSKFGLLGITASLLLHVNMASAEVITQAGSWPGYPRHSPSQVSGDGTNACLVGYDGLQIIDLSNPSAPQAHSFLPCFAPFTETPTDIDLQSESNRVCIGVRISYLGNYIYTLKGIDLSDLANPVHVWNGSLNHPPNQVCMDGNLTYSSHNLGGLSVSTWGVVGYGNSVSSVTNASGRVVCSGDRLYVPTLSGFQMFSKATRALLGTFDAGAETKALSVSENHAYLATMDERWLSLPIRSMDRPTCMSSTSPRPPARRLCHACTPQDNPGIWRFMAAGFLWPMAATAWLSWIWEPLQIPKSLGIKSRRQTVWRL